MRRQPKVKKILANYICDKGDNIQTCMKLSRLPIRSHVGVPKTTATFCDFRRTHEMQKTWSTGLWLCTGMEVRFKPTTANVRMTESRRIQARGFSCLPGRAIQASANPPASNVRTHTKYCHQLGRFGVSSHFWGSVATADCSLSRPLKNKKHYDLTRGAVN